MKKDTTQIRIPWAKYDNKDVHIEYVVGIHYGDLGECRKIIEHTPGHCDIIFEKEFITYCFGLITKGEFYEDQK